MAIDRAKIEADIKAGHGILPLDSNGPEAFAWMDARTACVGHTVILLAEVARLRAAIRNHRDQRGDDRCWLDDQTLYEALGEPIPENAQALPPKADFLTSCERYYEQRRCPAHVYPPGKMRIAELEAEVERISDHASRDTTAERERDSLLSASVFEVRPGEFAYRLGRHQGLAFSQADAEKAVSLLAQRGAVVEGNRVARSLPKKREHKSP